MEKINKNYKVSIIMPAYNAADMIKTSINSVLNQTYRNWELLIINDCSKDNTVEVVKRYIKKDDRITLIDLKENIGVAGARNAGINKAKGKYIAFLDSDDYWTADKLMKQTAFMNKNSLKFSYTNMFVVDENEKVTGERIAPSLVTYFDLLKSNHIGCLTVMLDASVAKNHLMEKVGHEDYLTWLKILKTGINGYNVNEKLGYYRVGGSSLSSNKIRAAKWQWNIYTNELGLNSIKSAYYFIHYLVKGLKKNI